MPTVQLLRPNSRQDSTSVPRHGARRGPSPSSSRGSAAETGARREDVVERSRATQVAPASPSTRPGATARTCPTTYGVRCRALRGSRGGTGLGRGRQPRRAAWWAVTLARDGAALGEALAGLRATYAARARGASRRSTPRRCRWPGARRPGVPPQLSCEDPLTGLASLAHLRTRLAEIYRGAELTTSAIAGSHALVVVELPASGEPPAAPTRRRSPGRCGWSSRPRPPAAVFSGGRDHRPARPGPGRRPGARGRRPGHAGRAAARPPRRTSTSARRRARLDRGPAAGAIGAAARRARPRLTVGTSCRRRALAWPPCVVATRPAGSPRTSSRSSRSDEAEVDEALAPDYNVAPTKEVYAVVERPPSRARTTSRSRPSASCGC